MAKHQGLLAIRNSAWETAGLNGKYSAGKIGMGRKDEGDKQAGDDDAVSASKWRALSRPSAVWIVIRALSVSIGMIVSAAVVTVTFLA